MKRITLFLVSLALAASTVFAETAVERYGDLKVHGNRILGKDSQPAQLRGMSFFWSIWQEGSRFYTHESVEALADEWKATVVRAALGVDEAGGYLDDTTQVYIIDSVVDAAIAKGIYVIVDWHTSYADNNTQAAKDFFTRMSTKYAAYPNVIYEIWNEPIYVQWSSVKTYAEQVIPMIRAHAPKALVLVGTPTWSQDVDKVVGNPVADSNVAYVLHFYAGTNGKSLRNKGDTAMAHSLPLFVSEFGTTVSDGGSNGLTYLGATDAWMQWMDQNKISWCNWSISDKGEASAAILVGSPVKGAWNSTDLSESGIYIRNKLRGYYTEGGWTNTQLSNPSAYMPITDTVQAENFRSGQGIVTTGTTDGGAGGYTLANMDSADWIEIPIHVATAGAYDVQLRIFTVDTNGGTLRLLVGDQVQDTVPVALYADSNGSYYYWNNFTATVNLPAGDTLLRIECIRTAPGNKLSLNYLLFTAATPIIGSSPMLQDVRVVRMDDAVYLTMPQGHGWTKASLIDVKGHSLASRSVATADQVVMPLRSNKATYVLLQGPAGNRVMRVK